MFTDNIPIFDSLTHPTINGAWIDGKMHPLNCIQYLSAEMGKYNIRWAFAAGMKNIGGYDEQKFASFIKNNSENIFPLGFFDTQKAKSLKDTRSYLRELKHCGYAGIKIHPRLSGISLKDKMLPSMIKNASDMGFLVFMCTYFYDNARTSPGNSIDSLYDLLFKVKDSRIIMLHSGSVRLLEMMEIARAYKNILLDLSFTMCKYAGSSLDFDIRYLFNNFDSRICIGSDSPEFDLKMLRERFQFFAEQINLEKAENIAFRNIIKFTGMQVS
ncbi:MAG: hypothetical protein K4571_12400 [Deltaproteobacteria bacterium]